MGMFRGIPDHSRLRSAIVNCGRFKRHELIQISEAQRACQSSTGYRSEKSDVIAALDSLVADGLMEHAGNSYIHPRPECTNWMRVPWRTVENSAIGINSGRPHPWVGHPETLCPSVMRQPSPEESEIQIAGELPSMNQQTSLST